MVCRICGEPACPAKGAQQRPLVWRCRDCGFEWVDREALGSTFEPPQYTGYDYNARIDAWFERMRPQYRRGLAARLARTLGEGAAGGAFLDIGCANGEYMRVAAEAGLATTAGVEVDAAAARRASRHGPVWADVADVPGTFDVVQIKNVLSNIDDLETFLATSLQRLRPGGYLYLDVLNEASLTALLRRALLDGLRIGQGNRRYGHLRPPYVINGFTPEAVRRLLHRQGLTLRHLRTAHNGSDEVPYSATLRTRLLGGLGSALGRGPMLVADAQRPADG